MSIDELETQYGAPSASGPDDLLPPQDVNAERSVIGSMLMSKDAIADVAEQVRGEDFYRPAHETIFDAVIDLYGRGEPADAITVADELSHRLEFRGFDHNDGLESHMASYVEFLVDEDHWTELQPQLERNDDGNSHHRTLGTYLRMLAEYRRIMDSRDHGFHRDDYLLSMDELEQIAAARTHPSHRG